MIEELLKRHAWFDHAEGLKFTELFRDSHRSVGHWLILPGGMSRFHRVRNNDEIWAIHAGGAILHVIDRQSGYSRIRLSAAPAQDAVAIAAVPVDAWQAAELAPGEAFAFGSNICAPSFDYAQWEMGNRQTLLREFPDQFSIIDRLAR